MGALAYRPSLDGLRAAAILIVVACHAGWLPSGTLGVELFFVLSGFLITTLLTEEHRRTGEISLSAFYTRRAARLLPGLWLLLGVYVGYGLIKRATWVARACAWRRRDRRRVRRELLRCRMELLPGALLDSSVLARARRSSSTSFGPSRWSCCYVVRSRRRRSCEAWWYCSSLGVFSDGHCCFGGYPDHRVAFAPDTNLDSLAIGCGASILWTRQRISVGPYGSQPLRCSLRSPRSFSCLTSLTAAAT